MTAALDADGVIELLGLAAHPEGGWFAETWRDEASTAIWFLLRAGERSRWHRLHDLTEVWHHYGGDALTLRLSRDGVAVESIVGQAAGYALVGCTVAPPFRFEAFELAPPGWKPG